MREALIMFGSIAAVLLGAILIYMNVFEGDGELGYLVGAGFGIIFLAAGITRPWMIRRLKKG